MRFALLSMCIAVAFAGAEELVSAPPTCGVGRDADGICNGDANASLSTTNVRVLYGNVKVAPLRGSPWTGFFTGQYIDWQLSRVRGMEKYLGKDFFTGKSTHEIGCAYAFFSDYASKRGASKVYCSDAREEHLEVVRERYPNFTVLNVNAEKELDFPKVDVMIHFGSLYHLLTVQEHLEEVAQVCDYLILESEVCSSEEEAVIMTKEDGYDQAFEGTGTRYSQKSIEVMLLRAGFSNVVRVEDSIFNGDIHHYDWNTTSHEGNHWINGQRRFWICWKSGLESPLLPQYRE